MATKRVDEPSEIGRKAPRSLDIDNELHEALVHLSTDDLRIVDLKRRKLMVRDEIARLQSQSKVYDDGPRDGRSISDSTRSSTAQEDEGIAAHWQEIKAEVLRLLQADSLDTPASHLAYIRERINPAFDHDTMES